MKCIYVHTLNYFFLFRLFWFWAKFILIANARSGNTTLFGYNYVKKKKKRKIVEFYVITALKSLWAFQLCILPDVWQIHYAADCDVSLILLDDLFHYYSEDAGLFCSGSSRRLALAALVVSSSSKRDNPRHLSGLQQHLLRNRSYKLAAWSAMQHSPRRFPASVCFL